MQKDVANHNIKLIYKICSYYFLFTIVSAIVNIAFNIITTSDSIFFTSFILLLMPYLKFQLSHNYFEIIPFIIFLSISILLFILNKKDFYDTKIKKSFFIPITALFYIHTVIFSCGIYMDNMDNYSYNYDNSGVISNMMFSLVYSIFFVITFLIKQVSSQKNLSPSDDDYPHMHLESFRKIKQLVNCTIGIEVGVFLLSLLITYLDTNNSALLISIPVFYVFAVIWGIVSFIGVIFEYKRLIRLNKDTLTDEKLLTKLNIAQLTSLAIFILSYLIFITIP